MSGLIIDNFAGGGGASTGIEAALGRPVDIAINHDEAAIAVHAANHPATRHYCQSIYSIDPMDATEGRPVALIWFSPDCKHHSKAKGGKPRDKNIRDLANVVPHWIERLKSATRGCGQPTVILLENVEEFRHWGPLDDAGMPIKERRGEEFDLWVRHIRKLGYKVEWRELRACDFGAPTSRKRLFLIARCDGLPIVWPAPTHGHPDSAEVRSGKLLPFRTAAECIDWSKPCPSIFGRKKSLAEATKRRIAVGVMRYVVNSARPFIVPVTHSGDTRVHSADEPLRTITTAHRGELAAIAPTFARTAHGEQDRNGKKRGRGEHGPEEPMPTVLASQDSALVASSLIRLRNNNVPRSVDTPLDTITAGGKHHAIASATLVGVGGRRGQSAPVPVDQPHPTITAKADGAIAAASMVQVGYGEREGQDPRALDVESPLGTVVAGGNKHAAVAAFLHKYRPNSAGAPADGPMPTVTANSFVKRGGGAPPLAVTSAHLEQANTGMVGHDMREPVSTIVGRGCTQRLVETTLVEEGTLPPELMESAVRVAAFLVKYYGSEVGQHQAADSPFDTATVKPRFAVVTVTIDAITFVLVDIGMRMLEPRELANAQGFPPDYILDPTCWYVTDSGRRKYGPLPKAHQIAKIGNSVCPIMAEVLTAANVPSVELEAEAA